MLSGGSVTPPFIGWLEPSYLFVLISVESPGTNAYCKYLITKKKVLQNIFPPRKKRKRGTLPFSR